MIRVLVSGAGGDVGQGVIKALERSTLDIKIYTTCIFPDSAFLHRVKDSYIAPYSNSDDYIPFLIRLIKKEKIDLFIPTVDSEIKTIALNKERISTGSGVKVLCDSLEKIGICDDKYATAEFLKQNNFAFPKTVRADEENLEEQLKNIGFPLIAKKRSGKGAQDVYKAHTQADLEKVIGNSEWCFQEYLEPEEGEYTSGIYLGDDGEVKGICTFKRELKCGSTFKAERVINHTLENQLADIAKKLGMKYLNIQSMYRDGVLYPFEFNGRFSGTTGMISRKVFNAPEMYIRERLLGETLQPVKNSDRFVAMRYQEEVYADVEDLETLQLKSRSV